MPIFEVSKSYLSSNTFSSESPQLKFNDFKGISVFGVFFFFNFDRKSEVHKRILSASKATSSVDLWLRLSVFIIIFRAIRLQKIVSSSFPVLSFLIKMWKVQPVTKTFMTGI